MSKKLCVLAAVMAMVSGAGFFIHPLLGIGLILLGSAAAGWVAGRDGTLKGFGAGMLFLLILTLIFAVDISIDPRQLLETVVPVGLSADIPVWVPMLFAAAALAAGTMIFLCVFNAAILFRRWYFVLCAALILLAEVMWLSPWLYTSLDALLDTAPEKLSAAAMLVLILLLLVLLTGWAVFNIRTGKHRTWRNFAWGAGGFAAAVFLAWSIASVSLCIYTGKLVERGTNEVVSRGRVPKEVTDRARKLADACSTLPLSERSIELPFCGTEFWCAGSTGTHASEETKRRTLDFAVSDEGKAYFGRNAELIELYCRIAAEEEFEPANSLQWLNEYRAAVRRCAAQSALAHYRGDAAAILPPLEVAEKLEQALYDCETTVIEGLVRIALTSIRMEMVVKCGQERPEYAPYYRAMLKRLLAFKAKIPAETGFILAELARVRRLETGRYTYKRDTSFYIRLMNYPAACAGFMRKLAQAEEYLRNVPEWRKTGMVPASAEVYGKAMLRALDSRAVYSIALALKIYRCETGAYPEKLDVLVPGILEKLPCDPATGKPLVYRKPKEGGFLLSVITDPSVKPPRTFTISPDPNY